MVRRLGICRRTVLKSTSAAAFGSIVGTAAGRENDHSSTEPPIASPPILAAHRGYRGLYPQNTIAAVQQAAYGGPSTHEYSTDMMECDLVPAGGKPWKGEDFEIVVCRKVVPYTITTWHQAEQLVEAGVDGIIADYPGVLD